MNSELFGDDFLVFRRDRDNGSGHRQGGGCLLAFKGEDGLKVERIRTLETEQEDLWVKVSCKLTVTFICVVYFPPSSRWEVFKQFFDRIHSNFDAIGQKNVIILGDFNLHSTREVSKVESDLDYLCATFGLSQCNDILNSNSRILDFVLCNANLEVRHCEFPLVPEDNFHPAIEFQCSLMREPLKSNSVPTLERVISRGWNFNKGNLINLYESMSRMDWSNLSTFCTVDEATQYFYSCIYDVFDSCFPKKFAGSGGRKYPKWFSREVISNIEIKHAHHKRWKAGGLQSEYDLFSFYRALVRREVRVAYRSYVSEIEENIMHDPKTFWHYIKSLRKDGGLQDTMMKGTQEFRGLGVANAFANHFQSVYNKDPPLLDINNAATFNTCGTSNVDLDMFTESDVMSAISLMKNSHSIGPDFVPIFFIKGCAEFLKTPLCHIFNLAISTSTFPEVWKTSKICPIFKNGSKKLIENYRPVAILSAPAKLFEKLIHKFLMPQIDAYIIPEQHGFRKGRSTETNLMVFTDYVARSLDSGYQVDCSYNDFSKAFDTVNHDILLTKLAQMGFSLQMLKFFKSYLKNRKQFVTHGIFQSAEFLVFSGVPQGSILGPLLFSIFINDIAGVIRFSRFLLFADDLKLFLLIRNIEDCLRLQADVDNISEWSQRNQLHFNVLKCVILTFTRAFSLTYHRYTMLGHNLKRVSNIKDLGIMYESKLTFRTHIEGVCQSALKMLGFVLRTVRVFRDTRALKILYFSLVRSRLESGSLIWNPHEVGCSLMLERVQKKFLRFLYMREYGHYPSLYPTNFLLGMLGLHSLQLRREGYAATHLFRLLRGDIGNPAILERVSLYVPDDYLRQRHHRLFYLPACRTNLPMVLPVGRSILLLNQISSEIDIFGVGEERFKREILLILERVSPH